MKKLDKSKFKKFREEIILLLTIMQSIKNNNYILNYYN